MSLMRLAIFSFTILLLVFADTRAQNSFAVIELFTSEGCNTCPPAEKIFNSISADAIKNHKNIFCLEYHVDYWNKLGWKDPYSSFQFTNRQQNYTSALGERELYTPMMFVNGETHFVGSDNAKANAAIDKSLKTPGTISLSIKIDSLARDTAFVSFVSSSTDKNYFLRFAFTESNLVSKITKGENAGKTLSHENVVRIFFTVDMKEKIGTAKIPLKNFKPNSSCELIAFIQHKQSFKILAAARSEIK
jgi:hypothetical protein